MLVLQLVEDVPQGTRRLSSYQLGLYALAVQEGEEADAG
jgi:hypothetical protein